MVFDMLEGFANFNYIESVPYFWSLDSTLYEALLASL